MNERDAARALSSGGLAFRRMADPSMSLIPPTLATFASATPAGVGRVAAIVSRDAAELAAKANADWHRICLTGGLFEEAEPRFFVAINCAAGDMPTAWRWAEVTLADTWDIMGAGAAGVLGNGYCHPGFVMLSLDGEVIARGDTWEREIGTVLVREPYSRIPFRQQGEWMITRPRTGDWERAAIERWLEKHSSPIPKDSE